jgi:tetratricopeptide (TPR) repeat protein
MTCGLVAFFVLAETDQADALWAEAHDVAERLGFDAELAWIDHRRAGVAWERGDIRGAIAAHERLLAYHRAKGDGLAEADSLHNLGEGFRDVGDFDSADRNLLDAEAVYRKIGATSGLFHNTHSRGDLALDRREYLAAMALYRKSMDAGIATDDRRFQAYCLAGMASALAAAGRDEDAAIVWGAVCAAEQSSGFQMLTSERRRYELHLTRLEQSAAWESGRTLTLLEAFATLGRPE